MNFVKNIDNPLVSVIVPSYNHARFITGCIESIVNQTYKNFELTVIDDGSTDNSPQVLKELQTKYGFRLVFQENHGVIYTLNEGLKKYSHGKYFTGCSSDDYWTLDKLEKQVSFLEKNPMYPMCFGKTYIINQSGEILQKPTTLKNKNLKGGNIFQDILFFKFHPPVNYLFKRSIFDEIGYYENTWAEDYYMNLKISEKYPLGYIDDFLSYYRVTDNEKAKNINLKSINSHKATIDLFTGSVYYKKAVKFWYLRCFYLYSKYSSTKKMALIGMIKNIDQFYKPYFLKSMVKLLILWK